MNHVVWYTEKRSEVINLVILVSQRYQRRLCVERQPRKHLPNPGSEEAASFSCVVQRLSAASLLKLIPSIDTKNTWDWSPFGERERGIPVWQRGMVVEVRILVASSVWGPTLWQSAPSMELHMSMFVLDKSSECIMDSNGTSRDGKTWAMLG